MIDLNDMKKKVGDDDDNIQNDDNIDSKDNQSDNNNDNDNKDSSWEKKLKEKLKEKNSNANKDSKDKKINQRISKVLGNGIQVNEEYEDILSELNVRNLNEEFKDEDDTLFRDEQVYQLIASLIGKNKPNPLLIGAAGVGKTKVVESLAHRIANDDGYIPDVIKGHQIYEIALSSIVAGSGIVGTLEEKIKRLIDFMSDPENKAIVFIDEIHMLFKNRGSGSYDTISQMLKPALSRGKMKIIGATTLQEAQMFMNDPALNRRFTRVIVDEVSQEQELEILKRLRPKYLEHYKNVKVSDEALENIVRISEKYKMADAHRPDTAITLMDRAMADAVIKRIKLAKSIESIDGDKKNFEDTYVELNEKRIEATAKKMLKGTNKKTETDFDLLEKDMLTLKGQDEAIKIMLKLIKGNENRYFPTLKPLSICLCGPSGVGKTEVTKIIAKNLTESKPIILNMTEYAVNGSESKIIGTTDGFVGYDSQRERVFDILESNPYQIILLDEFEKAAKSVQRLFMQALDEGYIKNSKGKILDFSKTIIIATTNAANTNQKHLDGFIPKPKESCVEDISELSKFFDEELLNRFTKIIKFNSLSTDTYIEIAKNKYEKMIASVKENNHSNEVAALSDTLPLELEEELRSTYIKSFGARPLDAKLKDYILDLLT